MQYSMNDWYFLVVEYTSKKFLLNHSFSTTWNVENENLNKHKCSSQYPSWISHLLYVNRRFFEFFLTEVYALN